jgi:hypothetical protein
MIAGHHVTDVLQASRGVHVSDSTTLALTCEWRMGVQMGCDQ